MSYCSYGSVQAILFLNHLIFKEGNKHWVKALLDLICTAIHVRANLGKGKKSHYPLSLNISNLNYVVIEKAVKVMYTQKNCLKYHRILIKDPSYLTTDQEVKY